MLWFYITLVVAASFFVVGWILDSFSEAFGWFFATLVCGMVATLILNVIMMDTGTTTTHHDTYQLKNMQQVSSLSGRFFLGSGYFGSDPAYYYYRNTGESRFRLEHVSADDAEIVEIDTTSTPHVVITYKYHDASDKRLSIFNNSYSDEFSYVFYIPNGSVSDSFNLGPQEGNG